MNTRTEREKPLSSAMGDARALKPLTTLEQCAKAQALRYLQLARAYRERNDASNAVACCVEGLQVTSSIARPLAVRDQLHDLLSAFDRQTVTSLLQRVRQPPSVVRPDRTSLPTPPARRPYRYLERLVSVHQLLDYPSEYRRFDSVYEDALSCIQSDLSCELYIVQYRAQPRSQSHSSGELYFAFVPAALISEKGPYYLTDICAVVRR